MNQSERDALRAKHQPDEDGYCKGCAARNFDGSTSVREFPCDAIQLLGAWETERNDIKTALGSIHVVDRVQNAADILWKV